MLHITGMQKCAFKNESKHTKKGFCKNNMASLIKVQKWTAVLTLPEWYKKEAHLSVATTPAAYGGTGSSVKIWKFEFPHSFYRSRKPYNNSSLCLDQSTNMIYIIIWA